MYRLLTFTVNGPRDDSSTMNRMTDPHEATHQSNPDDATTTHVERLLSAVDRLRKERDELRRHVDFLETEARFSAPTSGASSTTPDDHVTRAAAYPADATSTIEQRAQVDAFVQCQIQDRDTRLADLQVQLDIAVQNLSDVTVRRDALQSKVSILESRDEERLAELQRLEIAHRETQSLLECTESSMAEISVALEEVQAERNSLALQLTNLQTDFCNAQEDLGEAERRYSTLQFHQLSSMSSNEAIQSLREQIEELENRVLRRTEQIGIHQHDIKRLETNMRLQEERIAEMTAELETLGAQKEAMVEDCADAREARNEALQKVESLEVELEALEVKVQALDESIQLVERSRELELSSLVTIIADAIGQHRIAKRRIRAAEDAANAMRPASLTAHQEITVPGDRGIIVALAFSQLELKRTTRELEDAHRLRASLQDQVTTLEKQHDGAHDSVTQHAQQLRDLESRLHDLHDTIAEMERSHHTTVQDLMESRRQLQTRLAAAEQMSDQDQHAEELAAITAQLVSTAGDRDLARQQHLETERRYQETSSECTRLRHKIEIANQAVAERSQICERLGTELSNLRAKHSRQRRQETDASIEQARQDQIALDGLRNANQQILEKLTRTEKDCENRLLVAAERSQADKRQLETELARSASQLAILQTRYDTCCETVTELERQLQDEFSYRSAEREEHERELAAFAECSAQSEFVKAKSKEEVDALRKELDQSKLALQTVREEKDAMRLDITNLEAEIQRSVSLRRYLESQVKDG